MPESIQFFATCLVDSLFPEVGLACLKQLEAAGVRVCVPKGQTCCGQPALNAGASNEARSMARYTLDVLERNTDPVVMPSGSCAAMVRHGYPELFRNQTETLKRARTLAARTYEFSEFLVDKLAWSPSPTAPSRPLAYHPSCHLLRGLGIDRQPRSLLAASGHEVETLPVDCCGFGGLFAVEMEDVSAAMLDRKVQQIEDSEVEVVVSGDVSCLMHLEGALRRRGSAVRCSHIGQVLDGQHPGLR